MGIFFNPELTRNAEVPNVDAVLMLQRQLLAATQLAPLPPEQASHAVRGSVDDSLLTPHNRTAQYSWELRR